MGARQSRGGRSAMALGLAIAGALPGCAGPFECTQELLGDEPSVDAARLSSSLVERLGELSPKGAGFAFSDGAGRLLGRGACGWSRDEPGERVAFTPRTPNNWGSVSKVVTAIAAIQAIEATPGASLDDPFGDYLPARWRAGLHPDYAAVSIRQLLQHKAGFAREGEIYEVDDDGAIVDLLEHRLQSPAEVPIGVRAYSNISPILLHFVIAYMVAPEAMAAREAEIAAAAPDDRFSREVNLAAAELYVAHVKEHLLAVAAVPGSCRITDFSDHALFYPRARAFGGGEFPREYVDGDHTDECSAGGWVLAPEGMLALLAAARHGEAILSAEGYALMESRAAIDERLGYSSALSTSAGRAFCHGGKYLDIEAAVCSFPGGVQAVINVNSPVEGGSQGLIEALVDAYEDARRG